MVFVFQFLAGLCQIIKDSHRKRLQGPQRLKSTGFSYRADRTEVAPDFNFGKAFGPLRLCRETLNQHTTQLFPCPLNGTLLISLPTFSPWASPTSADIL